MGSGCSIGAGPVYRKETIINYIRSRQFPRPGSFVLPNLAVGIPRDEDRLAMAVLYIARDDIRGVTNKRLFR